MSVFGSSDPDRDVPRFSRLAAAKRLDLDAVVTARLGLADVTRAFDLMLAGEGARLKMLRCEPAQGSGATGTVLDDHLSIACGEGAIRITELQRAGRAPMKAADFLRGTAVKPPARFA